MGHRDFGVEHVVDEIVEEVDCVTECILDQHIDRVEVDGQQVGRAHGPPPLGLPERRGAILVLSLPLGAGTLYLRLPALMQSLIRRMLVSEHPRFDKVHQP